MPRKRYGDIAIAIAVTAAFVFPAASSAQRSVKEIPMTMVTLEIPQSLQVEHEAIHAALVEATKAPGQIGAAARHLAEVLHPHFVREEQIALPPLGLLARLAAGENLSADETSEALAMTDSLRRELPRMLEEHTQIKTAVAGLRRAATEQHATKYQQLADQLALHAQTEEEVLYPAAVLLGDLLRLRSQGSR